MENNRHKSLLLDAQNQWSLLRGSVYTWGKETIRMFLFFPGLAEPNASPYIWRRYVLCRVPQCPHWSSPEVGGKGQCIRVTWGLAAKGVMGTKTSVVIAFQILPWTIEWAHADTHTSCSWRCMYQYVECWSKLGGLECWGENVTDRGTPPFYSYTEWRRERNALNTHFLCPSLPSSFVKHHYLPETLLMVQIESLMKHYESLGLSFLKTIIWFFLHTKSQVLLFCKLSSEPVPACM